jgi:exodeoxyribonuclease V alpha subunit
MGVANDKTPQRLTEIRGITPEIAQGVREEWLRRREQANAITILSGYGLTPYQVDKLIDAFGDSAVRVVQDNPYILMEKVDGFGFRKADEVALKAGTAKANPNRLRAGLLFTMKKVLEEGSTCLPKSEFLQQALALLVLDGDDARGLVNGALDHLRDAKEMVVFESQGTEPQVALESMHRMELHIATVFQKWGCRHA